MTKQVVLIILLSIVAILFKGPVDHILMAILSLHQHIINFLGHIFTHEMLGETLESLIALIIIPAVVGCVAALVFWISKKPPLEYTMEIVWVVWLILAITFTLRAAM